jgi:hypothetical protein
MKDLEFQQQPMTAWFSPRQLATTGLYALLSSVFGAYADKRELQAALDPPDTSGTKKKYLTYDLASDGEFWMDYVADLGDGFDPTYTVAYLLSRPTLDISYEKDKKQQIAKTRRAALLMMGGDQVYPSATREEYRNRLYGPYEAAMSWHDEKSNPHLYAIPGNHDWYDGLTSFVRLFCQHRWIGGWETQQTRSYFAAKLPSNWWLWGLDLQLTADIDDPQLKYFESVAKDIRAGDRLIISTPGPNWVKVGMGHKDAFEVLDFFLKSVVPKDADISVLLSGDLHHYARYTSSDGGQRITAGGGGAYLYPTHNLPKEFEIEREDRDNTKHKEKLELQAVYPEATRSKALASLAIFFLRRNLRFAAFLGALYVLFAWTVESASNDVLLGKLRLLGAGAWPEVMAEIWNVVWRSPSSSVFALVIVLGLLLFASSDRKDTWRTAVGRLVGAIHGLSHVVLAGTLMWLVVAILDLQPASRGTHVFYFIAAVFVAGALAGGMLMGLYLFASNLLLKLHDNETFSSQAIVDYKNFVRLKIMRDGSLTIFPVAIDNATKSWKVNPNAAPGDPWLVPASDKLPECKLAEPPVVVGAGVTAAGGYPQPDSRYGARV